MATSSFAAPVYVPRFRAFDLNGAPLAGGKLYTYVSGTSTPQPTYPTYADALAGTNANANPVVLDANGEASVFGQALPYKFILRDSADTVQWTQDAVYVGIGKSPASLTAFSAAKNGDQTGGFYPTAGKITNWTVSLDSLSEWNAANHRLVFASAGNYLVQAQAEYSDVSTSAAFTLQIAKNGTVVAQADTRASPTASYILSVSATTVIAAVDTDYVEVFAKTGATTPTVKGTIGTRFNVVRIL